MTGYGIQWRWWWWRCQCGQRGHVTLPMPGLIGVTPGLSLPTLPPPLPMPLPGPLPDRPTPWLPTPWLPLANAVLETSDAAPMAAARIKMVVRFNMVSSPFLLLVGCDHPRFWSEGRHGRFSEPHATRSSIIRFGPDSQKV